MLQFEVSLVVLEIQKLTEEFKSLQQKVEDFSALLLDKVNVDLLSLAEVTLVKKEYENIAGIEIPVFHGVDFKEPEYSLFDTPVWTESATNLVQQFITAREKVHISEEKKRALEKELREVSIRVNLFEKVLIPRSVQNIKKIRVFLGDQQLSSVAQAKVAKRKIENRKKEYDR